MRKIKTMQQIVCKTCQGTKKFEGKPCKVCGGTGVQPKEKKTLVTK